MAASHKLQLHIALCDDEPAMVDLLEHSCRQILGDKYDLQLLRASSAGALLPGICACQIALLDVQLAEECGIDLAGEILARNPGCRIIFVSGYIASVTQVYNVPHFCFILKNQLSDYLPTFLMRAAQAVEQESGRQLTIQCGKKSETLELSRISHIERNIHQTTVYISDGGTFQTREKLSDLMSRIDSPAFLRCHVSYIVNLQHAASIDGNCFCMDTGAQITISRPHEKAAREAFFHHLWDKS